MGWGLIRPRAAEQTEEAKAKAERQQDADKPGKRSRKTRVVDTFDQVVGDGTVDKSMIVGVVGEASVDRDALETIRLRARPGTSK